jgi:hypothetical protein
MFARTFAELRRYPSAIFGLSIIVVLVALSIYTVITIPYEKAIQLWRGGQTGSDRRNCLKPSSSVLLTIHLPRRSRKNQPANR